MTSEIRANIIKNRVGLGTIEYSNTGPIISGVTTALNFKTGTSNLHNTGLSVQDLDVDGHTNLDNVSIAGITTGTIFKVPDATNAGGATNHIAIGDNSDLKLFHDNNGNAQIFNSTGHLTIVNNTSGRIINLQPKSGANGIIARYEGAAELYHNNVKRLETTSVGVSIPQDLDVNGHTNLDNVSIAGVSTVTTFLQVLGQAGTSDKGFEVRSNSTQNTDTNQAIRVRNNSDTDTFKVSYKGMVTATELDISGKIDVDGHTNLDNLSVAGVSTFSGSVTAHDYRSGGGVGNTLYLTSADDWRFRTTGGSERLRIDSSGNVNIGMTGESTRLAVKGISGALSVDSRANISLFTGATDGASATGTGILFFNHSGSGQFFGGSLQVIKENSGNGNTDSLMRFATRANGGAVTERMRITSGGTLGINLLSPDTSFRLDCSGAAQFTTSTTNQQNDFLAGQLTVRNNQSAQGAFIDFRADSNNGTQGVIAKIGGFNTYNGSGYDGLLTFSTRQNSNNTMVERARITSGGEFLVGATSSAGARAIIQQNSSDTNPLDQNTSADSSGLRIQNYSFGVGRYTALSLECANSSMVQSASIIAQSVSSGQSPDIIIATRTSVGGNTERLRLDNSGRLGLSHDLSGTADYNRLMIHNPNSGSCWLQMTSTATGTTANTDGLSIGLNTSNIAHFWLRENADMYFATNGTKRWTITSTGDLIPGGNYDIGMSSNAAFKMNEVHSNKFVHRYGNSGSAGTNEQEAIWYGGGITVMHDNQTLNTTNYTWGLTGSRGYALLRIKNAAGSPQAIYAEAGSITSGSDYRMKENIVEITNGIETVKKLKPSIYNIRKTFNPNDDGKKHHGFIAHEVQEAIPDIGNIVSGVKDGMEEVFYQDEDENIPEGKKPGDSTGTFTDNPDYQGIDYGHITPVLAAAIKELITKVETLETEVASLKSS